MEGWGEELAREGSGEGQRRGECEHYSEQFVVNRGCKNEVVTVGGTVEAREMLERD